MEDRINCHVDIRVEGNKIWINDEERLLIRAQDCKSIRVEVNGKLMCFFGETKES